jgi:hypothetical protein
MVAANRKNRASAPNSKAIPPTVREDIAENPHAKCRRAGGRVINCGRRYVIIISDIVYK